MELTEEQLEKKKLFNDTNFEKLNKHTRTYLERDVIRTFFFAQILANEVGCNNESFAIHNDIRTEGNLLLAAIQRYLEKVKPATGKRTSWWLQKQLSKEKMADLAVFMETFVQMDNFKLEEIYSAYTDLTASLIIYQKTNKKINYEKFIRLFEMASAELRVEAYGGDQAFGVTTDGTLALNIVTPKPNGR
jgi:hypothetical protein